MAQIIVPEEQTVTLLEADGSATDVHIPAGTYQTDGNADADQVRALELLWAMHIATDPDRPQSGDIPADEPVPAHIDSAPVTDPAPEPADPPVEG